MRYGAEFVRECLPGRAKMSLCGLGADDPKALLLDVVGSPRRKARLDARRHEQRARHETRLARSRIERGHVGGGLAQTNDGHDDTAQNDGTDPRIAPSSCVPLSPLPCLRLAFEFRFHPRQPLRRGVLEVIQRRQFFWAHLNRGLSNWPFRWRQQTRG